MLLALRSLWESQAPPPPFIPSAAGVAVIYQLGMGWALVKNARLAWRSLVKRSNVKM